MDWNLSNQRGEVFEINLDGSGFTNLAALAGTRPYGDLTLSPSGTNLFGMTQAGGTYSQGTVFAIENVPIPEPGTVAMVLLLGGTIMGWRRLRRWR